MSRRTWFIAAIIGIVTGVVLASLMAFMDWRLNPSGLFHDESGTNWPIVRVTWTSWFVPVAAAAAASSLPILYWLARAR